MEASGLPEIGLIGATGRIGRAAARLLATSGGLFRVVTRDAARASRRLGPHAQVIDADCSRPDEVARALAGCERVMIACGDPRLEPALVAALRGAGSIRRIVKISAAGRCELPAPAHADAERALLGSGIPATILRPTFLVQSLAELLPLWLAGEVIRSPIGDAPVSYVDARDVAAVALHGLIEDGHDGATWTVTGPVALTMADVACTLSRVVGRAFRSVTVPIEGAIVPPEHVERVALAREGALAVVTDVVGRIGRVEPRTFSRYAATHDWDLGPPAALHAH